MIKTTLKFFLCFVLMFCLIQAMDAQVTVYNNFGQEHDGWDYNYQLGWTVAGENVPAQYGIEQAMSFTSTDNGVLCDIWIGIFSVPDNVSPDTVYIKLASNPAGSPPESANVLEEWIITGFPTWTQWNPPVHIEGNGLTVLEQGASYWLWLVASDESNTGWCMNIDPGLLCPHTIRREGEDWLAVSDETAGAFRVDVESPEGIDGGEIVIENAIWKMENYPNPFNPSTTIKFSIPDDETVDLAIYNVKGQKIKTLISDIIPAGQHSVTWNGIDDFGSIVSSGIYFYTLRSGSHLETKRMLLLK